MGVVDRIRKVWSGFRKGRPLIPAAGLLVSGLALILYVGQPVSLRQLDNQVYDLLVKSIPRATPTQIPVIVDLDEESLNRFGQWPWPRTRVASLVEKIRRYGAMTVALDIIFAEKDRTSPSEIQAVLRKEMGIAVEFQGLPAALMDNDRILANVLSSGPFVLGYKFFTEGGQGPLEDCLLHPVKAVILKSPGLDAETPGLFVAPDVICCLRPLAEAVKRSGFLNTSPDVDGILRRSPLVMEYAGQYYPSLALAAHFNTLGLDQVALKMTGGGLEEIVWGKTHVPVDARGRLLLNYRGPGRTFAYYSAADIFDGSIPPGAFNNKIVLVGSTAGGLKDRIATPFDNLFPGVEVHATILDNLLQQDFLSRPHWANGLEVMLIIITGVLSVVLLTWSRSVLSLLVLLTAAFGLWMGARWSLRGGGMYVSPLMPLMTLAVNFTVLTLLKFWREETEKRFFHTAFSHYVSASVVQQMVKAPEKLSLSGEEKEVSILFSDIRGFTSISENLPPDQVSRLLKSYFTPMTRLVIENSGTMDKFIGDAIMAFWNAPLDTPNHQDLALKTALGMLRELAVLNPRLQKEFGAEINIGIGLHCGRVSVGNMGTEDLFDYTIIGDSVNLASRLEGLTRIYGLPLLLSESIRQASSGNFVFQEIDKVRVKGKETPVTIFTAYEAEAAAGLRPEMDRFESALSLYRARRFEEAYEAFARLAVGRHQLKLYRLFEERSRRLREMPPGEEWDSVFDYPSK